jgi:hypothetical protein
MKKETYAARTKANPSQSASSSSSKHTAGPATRNLTGRNQNVHRLDQGRECLVAFPSCRYSARGRTGRSAGAQFPGAAVYGSPTARTIRARALMWLEDAWAPALSSWPSSRDCVRARPMSLGAAPDRAAAADTGFGG